MTRLRRRGFTIAELAFVIAVMAIITSLTVPALEVLVRRARADEARITLAAISDRELQHFRDTGKFLACPATGDVPRGTATPFVGTECWKELGLTIEGDVRFRYAVEVSEPTGFTVVAEGDLDADGVTSSYRLDGRSQALTIKEALE